MLGVFNVSLPGEIDHYPVRHRPRSEVTSALNLGGAGVRAGGIFRVTHGIFTLPRILT